MGRNRFAEPDVERLPLTDGDWIEVKKDLNTGDQKKLESAGLKPPVMVDGRLINPIDWEVYEIERTAIFLTDWSFTRKDDKNRETPVRIDSWGNKIAALRALTPSDFEEVNVTILQHISRRVEAKKQQREAIQETTNLPQQDTEPVSEPTST